LQAEPHALGYILGKVVQSFQGLVIPLSGVAAGENLAPKFKSSGDGVWELTLAKPVTSLPRGKLTVEVKDRQGHASRIERAFHVTGGSR
jgi:hypothetical protein